uniref:Uncharacterized protein n=1 Tax=Octopus bimaculoides TaxID=37653 RepID=A0A0L8FU34_OCTBM
MHTYRHMCVYAEREREEKEEKKRQKEEKKSKEIQPMDAASVAKPVNPSPSNDIMLNVTVEGKRSKCYQYGQNNHLKAFCPQLKQKEGTTPLIQAPPTPKQLKQPQQQQEKKTQEKKARRAPAETPPTTTTATRETVTPTTIEALTTTASTTAHPKSPTTQLLPEELKT